MYIYIYTYNNTQYMYIYIYVYILYLHIHTASLYINNVRPYCTSKPLDSLLFSAKRLMWINRHGWSNHVKATKIMFIAENPILDELSVYIYIYISWMYMYSNDNNEHNTYNDTKKINK